MLSNRCIVLEVALQTQDARAITIPKRFFGDGSAEKFTVFYHLMSPKFSAEKIPEEKSGSRRLEVTFVPETGLLIGGTDSYPMDSHVSIFAGGFELEFDSKSVWEKFVRTESSRSGWLTHFRCSPSRSVSDQGIGAFLADHFVASTRPLRRFSTGEYSISFLDDLRFLRDNLKPFASAIGPDFGVSFTEDDLDWLTLAALGSGSRHFMYHNRSGVDGRTRQMRDFRYGDLLRYSDRLQKLVPTRIPVQTNVRGIRGQVCILGHDCLLLTIVNEWTTRSSYQGSHSFFAVPRSGVIASVSVPAGWSEVEVVPFSGPSKRFPVLSGSVDIPLDEFQIGRAMFVNKSIGGRPVIDLGSEQSSLDVAENLANIDAVESPFRSFGERFPGESVAFRLKLKLRGDFMVMQAGRKVDSESLGDGSIQFTVDVPGGQGMQCIRFDVFEVTEGTRRLATSCFATFKVLTPFYSEPSPFRLVVDEPQVLTIRTSDDRFKDFEIQDLRCSNPDLDYEATVDGNTVRIVAKFDSQYSREDLAGHLTAHIGFSSDNYKRSVYLPVPFLLSAKNRFRGKPNALLLTTLPASKKIVISNVDDTDSKVIAVEVTAIDAISVDFAKNEFRKTHVVELQANQSLSDVGNAVVNVTLEDINGIPACVSVPVRYVRLEGLQLPKDERLARLHSRVVSLTDRYVTDSAIESAPNWVLLHMLLVADAAKRNAILSRLFPDDKLSPAFFSQRKNAIALRSGDKFQTEHHFGQFVYLLACSNVDSEENFQTKNGEYKVKDAIAGLKSNLEINQQELAWVLPALAHYSDGQALEWQNKFGETVSFQVLCQRLIDNEDPTCGGTHRMIGLARIRESLINHGFDRNLELRLLLEKIESKLVNESALLESRIQLNGCFIPPPMFLEDKGTFSDDLLTDIHFTGHCLEWLSVYDSSLNEPWVIDVVDSLERSISRRFPTDEFNFSDGEACRNFGNLMHALCGLKNWAEKVRRQIKD